MKKFILLLDLNSFFASAEIARKPELKGKEVAIGSYSNHSVAVAMTNNLKQKGVYVGMPSYKIKLLAPKTIFIKPDHKYYVNLANSVFNFVKKNYTSKTYVNSIDEAYVDISELVNNGPDDPDAVAQSLIDKINLNFDLPVSIGISDKKVLAKMASNFNKNNAFSTCYSWEVKDKIWPLKVEKVPGIGKALTPLFENYKIDKIFKLALIKKNRKETYNELKKIIGIRLDELIDYVNGIEKNNIFEEYTNPKSLSKQITLNKRIKDFAEISNLTKLISDKLSQSLFVSSLSGNRINVLIRYEKFDQVNLSKTFKKQIYKSKDIYNCALEIFETLWSNNKEFKGMRITISNLQSAIYKGEQINIFHQDTLSKDKKNFIDLINHKLGYEALFKGEDFKKNPRHKKDNMFASYKIKFKTWK